jgi:hypothetical protein
LERVESLLGGVRYGHVRTGMTEKTAKNFELIRVVVDNQYPHALKSR